MSNLSRAFLRQKLAIALIVFLSVQGAAFVGTLVASYISQQDALSEVLQRISLDTSRLDLGNDELNSVPNRPDIAHYIDSLNTYLIDKSMPLQLVSINGIKGDKDPFTFSNTVSSELLSNEQKVTLALSKPPLYSGLSVSYLALFSVLCWLLLPTRKQRLKGAQAHSGNEKSETPNQHNSQNNQPVKNVVINLKTKTLSLEGEEESIVLQNKPLCFYIALLKYCAKHPNSHLNHQQAIPEELLKLANDAFAKLIELGHTKRKRPDFSANLDKTLSEIRAVLDELFIALPQQKQKYYPPRAQGEGSRSKQHSYALTQLNKGDVTFIEN
ncbi:hypothetical protein DRW07_09380 [Alteromonas sediminis]|uniref:Uncharacterized protein n=1 Tax=Alteromonas sediminis TaxID=2259342 RepID=A0A3N5XYP7_9ALTE|nr:hypothetical protein [Alteromonas sediminis]RPJ66297.1 hypothetical protein DRW07_09380 [Alteromonas sediminis]